MVSLLKSNYIYLKDGLGLRRLKGTGDNKKRIIFFPFVGGQSLSFKSLARELPDDMDVMAIDLPGHGWANGKCIDDFEEMIDLLYNELLAYFNGDFYLFGHSLGGIIAYRISQMLEKENIHPKRVIISASPLPHRIDEYRYIGDKDMKELIKIMSDFGGINSVFLDNEKHLEYYFKTIKADIDAFLKVSISINNPIKSPVTVFYSEDDSFVNYTDIFEWGIYGQDVSFQKVKGKHIFVQTEFKEVSQSLVNLLE